MSKNISSNSDKKESQTLPNNVWDANSYSYKPHTKHYKTAKTNIQDRPAWKRNTIIPPNKV